MINVQNSASLKIDEIYRYTLKTWGEEQAKSYVNDLFESFNNIGNSLVVSYPIPADFGINGFCVFVNLLNTVKNCSHSYAVFALI